MSVAAKAPALPARSSASFADLVALTKPRINGLVLCTTATGLFLAPGHLSPFRAIVALLGTAFVVAGANTLNNYVERETDGRMLRTRNRPLAAGRVEPAEGLLIGLLFAIFSVPLLCLVLNPMTGLLALVAFVSYVWVYTPLKRVTPLALWIGAVPGAIPPLMGWTAVTGRFDAGGLWLFAILFVWQLPHFLAITLYLKDDYARGGHKVFPLVRGERAARWALLGWTLSLLPVSLGLVAAHVAGWGYGAVAVLLWIGFLAMAIRGLRTPDGVPTVRMARRIFAYSIVYLLVLFGALLADHRPAAPAAPAAAVAALR